MRDETIAIANGGEVVHTIHLYCEGTTEYLHEQTQTHLLVQQHSDLDAWEIVSGLIEWQYVTDSNEELDMRRGKILSSSVTGSKRRIGSPESDDIRARLILRCGYCPREVRVLRQGFENVLQQVVHRLPSQSPGEWEIELKRFSGV